MNSSEIQFRPARSNPQLQIRRTGPRHSTREDPLSGPAESVSSVKRRKSRSPGGSRSGAQAPVASSSSHNNSRKRRHHISALPTSTSISGPAPVPSEDVGMPIDRGRRSIVKPRSRISSRPLAENNAVERSSQIPQRREGSRSRDPHQLAKKHASTELGVLDKDKEKSAEPQSEAASALDFSGPLAAAEFLRLKKEIESLKKQAHEHKKTIKKQSKTIEELKLEVSNNNQTVKDKEQQMQKYKSKSKKSEELITSIEANMQCQICMELLLKPFSLSPCGHILCLGCLQEWFRKAPADANDMHDDGDDPEYLIYRRKTCPCCRATVVSRPAPLFLVKSIATSITKFKSAGTPSRRSSPPALGDPWEGLFPPVDEEGFEVDPDTDPDDEEVDDEDYDDERDGWMLEVFSYGTASDVEPYEGEYIIPKWEPPAVDIDPEDYAFEDITLSELTMLRRGVTLSMLDTFSITYTHISGLIVAIDDYRVFLGWNIAISGDDESGEAFIDWVLNDIEERPERWDIVHHVDGTWDAKRLVPAYAVEDYETTDSEAWLDGEMEPL